MNSESQLRISSIALTVACILCGFMAASWLIPLFRGHGNDLHSSLVAANLKHLNYSEFQANGDSGAATVPDSGNYHAVPMSNVRTGIPTKTPGVVGLISSTRDLGNVVHSTSFERSVSQGAMQSDSVPGFYAPVTVHPVTVNIDNSGVLSEIARVHQRLDLLTSESGSPEVPGPMNQNPVTSAPAEQSEVRPTNRRFEYIVHDGRPKDALTNGQRDRAEKHPVRGEAESAPDLKPVPTRIPTASPKSNHEPVQFGSPSVNRDEPFTVTPEPNIRVPLPKPAPEPVPEIEFEAVPQQKMLTIPDAELPEVELQSDEIISL